MIENRMSWLLERARFSLLILGALIAFCATPNGIAKAQEISTTPPLKIGVYISPPFVEHQGAGSYRGMAIDLWTDIARKLDLTYDYEEFSTIRALQEAVASGTVAAAVTNLTITRERAEDLVFTQPWYDAGLRLMVPETGAGGSWDLLAGLGDAGHLTAYAWLAAVIAIATIGLTLFDRRFDPSFPKRWRDGFAESFHHVMLIATSGRTVRKNLFGWVGRIWQALWLLVGVAVIAYVTSSVTSVMTTLSLTRNINSMADMSGKTAGVFTGSVAERFVTDLGISARAYDNIEQSVAALHKGEIDAIVGDAPILEHYALTNPGAEVDVVGKIVHPDKYGFAFPAESVLVRPVTLEILAAQETGYIETLRLRYFGSD